jgi:hypothetical protein
MRKGALGKIDVQHDRRESGSYVVESFIARDDDSVFIPACAGPAHAHHSTSTS